MDWQEVTISINKPAVEAVTSIMEEFGAGGVVLDDDQERVDITAYYPADTSFEDLLINLKDRIYNLNNFDLDTGEVEFRVRLTCNEDWATSWHKYFKPTPIGNKFLICPEWEECTDEKRIIIKINPGMAFGIGGHESTQLALHFLEKYYRASLNDFVNNVKMDFSVYNINNMLDVGSGTGILSIAAARLGVRDILAVDKSQAAVRSTRDNIKLNQVEDRVKVLKCDLSEGLYGTYNFIIANLLPGILQSLLPIMVSYLQEPGLLILSGIIEEKREQIYSQATGLNLSVIDEKGMGDWLSLVARKG